VNLLGDCRGGAERIRCIMEDLKILSDREGGPDEIIDVVSVFRSAVSLLSHEITANGTLVEDYRSAPYVRANPGRLGQVFVNLLTNAIHALLNISVEGQISVSTWACDNGGVAIEVRDNGCGMSLETLNHAFDPFFTTKCPAGGRGLGLSTCHKIITDYGGEITVESAPGKGSSFCIVLPSD
jgi:signal transduction histidine kinase